jgi:hypothetical protein
MFKTVDLDGWDWPEADGRLSGESLQKADLPERPEAKA